jgi:RNA polymerase sigma-70 factor (ECF subfamily)
MHEHAERLAGHLVSADEGLEQEFEARISDSSTLAFRVAYSALRQREDAEDVAQDALVRAYRRFRQLRDRERFRAWLVRTTWRLALDRQRADRRRATRELAAEPGPEPTAGDPAVARERAERLWEAIAGLPEKLRLTIVLAGIEGLDVLEVEIVVSRYQGDRPVSRTPYTLAVNAASERTRAEAAQLNIGAEVPVPVTTFTPAGNDNPGARPMVSFNYRHVGTTIECWAVVRSDGRYVLNVSIDESSVYTGDSQGAQSTVAGSPVFRSYESRNTLLLRNGQSRQYIAATDRVSGEVIRIEVALRVAD